MGNPRKFRQPNSGPATILVRIQVDDRGVVADLPPRRNDFQDTKPVEARALNKALPCPSNDRLMAAPKLSVKMLI
jgi:hypothetical protein